MDCKCGCGESFTPSRTTLWRMSKGIGGYLPGHAHRGANNPRWRGGRFVSENGYIYLLRPEHPNALKTGYIGYVAEHRMVMSESLSRPLLETELVHHKNGIKADNRIDNLVIISRAEHVKEHHGGTNNCNWKGQKPERTCAACGNTFQVKFHYLKPKFCSKKCRNAPGPQHPRRKK